MTLEEYEKNVVPGTRVFVIAPGGIKLCGVAGNMLGADGVTKVVKFEDGQIAKVTEKSVRFFELEVLH